MRSIQCEEDSCLLRNYLKDWKMHRCVCIRYEIKVSGSYDLQYMTLRSVNNIEIKNSKIEKVTDPYVV